MLELEEALTRILSALPAPESERIPLAQSDGRVLAEQVLSPLDLPVFDNSAMDGYAVRAKDAAAAKLSAFSRRIGYPSQGCGGRQSRFTSPVAVMRESSGGHGV